MWDFKLFVIHDQSEKTMYLGGKTSMLNGQCYTASRKFSDYVIVKHACVLPILLCPIKARTLPKALSRGISNLASMSNEPISSFFFYFWLWKHLIQRTGIVLANSCSGEET